MVDEGRLVPRAKAVVDVHHGDAARARVEHDLDGYLGYADLEGASPRYIATIAHTDIVPLGLGWTVDPLDVTRRDGYLLGRGVLDDKGPFVLSLYAAHFFCRQVAETGQRLPYTLRCIIGNNEETGMKTISASELPCTPASPLATTSITRRAASTAKPMHEITRYGRIFSG